MTYNQPSFQLGQILTLKEVEPPDTTSGFVPVVVEVSGVLQRAHCVVAVDNPPTAAPLQPGDAFVVDAVPNRGHTQVERCTGGQRDGCRYMLYRYQPLPQQA
jgi:hypothetical protein